MATRGENCNDWSRTVLTGGCLLVAFPPDGVTDNDDYDANIFCFEMQTNVFTHFVFASKLFCLFRPCKQSFSIFFIPLPPEK